MINTKLKIADLIFSFIKDEINEEDSQDLHNWINSSSQNKALFDNLLNQKSFSKKSEIYETFIKQDRYPEIRKNIRKEKVRKMYKYASMVAAVLLPLIVVYVLFFQPKPEFNDKQISKAQVSPGKSSAIFYTADGEILNLEEKDFEIEDKTGTVITNNNSSLIFRKDTSAQNETIERLVKAVVPRGGEYYLELSDGTKVWLNSESSIEHPIVFANNQRVVTITGEAYFEVNHDKNRPFIIHANNTSIEVLGTEFNVRAYLDEDQITTTLVKGKVRTKADNNSYVILNPSEQSRYNKKMGTYEVSKVDIELYTSWKNGLFVFNKQSLEEIMNTIARWYDVEIFYENDKSRKTLFSGRLKKYENADNLLDLFKKIEDVEFEIGDKHIVVK